MIRATLANLTIERDGAVAIVTINRPKVLNALNIATLDELRRAMLELQHDEAVRVRGGHRRGREVLRRRRRHQRAGGADADRRPRARDARASTCST